MAIGEAGRTVDGDRGQTPSSFRLAPFTPISLERLESRKCRKGYYGFYQDCQNRLPECESVSVDASGSLSPGIFSVPLEDTANPGTDKTFCVIVKRSANCYLYRFSAEDSLFIFSPWSSLRRFAIQISCHKFFELFVMTTILLNCVFLALSQPIEETEYVFLGIYTIEMIIKSVAKGFILNKYTYLRNPWNWLDFIVVVSGYITLGLQAVGVAIGNLAGLRTFRVLRALKTVSVTPGLKTIVNAMLHSLGMLAEVMTLTVFCLMVFALLALQLYVGVLRQKCVLHVNTPGMVDTQFDHVANKSMWLLEPDGQPAVCGNKTGARHCPMNYTCLPGIGDNPNFGYTNFDSYGWALLTTFQLITLDFWEDVYNKINAATGPYSVAFFMIVVFFGSFYLINLTLAVVAIAYEEEAATTLKEQDNIKAFSLDFPKKLTVTLAALKAKTKILPFRSKRSEPLPRWCTPRQSRTEGTFDSRESPHRRRASRNLIAAADDRISEEDNSNNPHPLCMGTPDIVISTGGRLPRPRTVDSAISLSVESSSTCCQDQNVRSSQRALQEPNLGEPVKTWIQLHFGHCHRQCCALVGILQRLRFCMATVVNDPLFDFVITVCILLNTAFLSVEHYGMTSRMERILRLGNLVFTIIFCSEAVLKLLALGRLYFRSKWNLFDLVVVVLSLADLCFETVSGLSVLRTFRLLRVVKLAQAWATMRLLLTIIAGTLGAVGNMTLVLAVIVYIFAILGVQLFSDIYTPEKFFPNPVPRWNFTDFWHSLLIIFRILCGEWVQPLWDCMRASEDKYQVCIVVFLVALTVGNFLVLNLFLAMLLNSFNSHELKEIKQKTNTDSRLLKGIRRIRRVLRRSANLPEVPEKKVSEGRGNFKRRWSEPNTPVHAFACRRLSEISTSTEVPSRQVVRCLPPSCLPPVIPEASTLDLESKVLFHKTARGDDENLVTCPLSPRNIQKMPPKEPPACLPEICMSSCGSWSYCEGFVSTWKKCRQCVLFFVDHKVFEWSVLVLIFASSVVLCFEDIYLSEKPRLFAILSYFNLFFTACFVLEVLLKWMAHGFVVYFGSLWTTVDFIIVCVSVASVIVESSGSGLYALRAIRTLRALRPLRAISRWQGMKIVVNALVSAVPSIFNVLLVCLVFWLIFSIMGVQFFSGKFYRCVDDTGLRLPVQVTPDFNRCLALNYSWVNRNINFDNVGNAYLALFQVATFEGWTEIIEDATDVTEIGHQPYTEANFSANIYFVVFIICGSFFTLNLFIGVIIDNFNMLKKKYEGGIAEMFLTDSQKTYYTAMLKLGRKKPRRIVSIPTNKYLRFFHDISISRKFELLVFLLIFLNMVAMTVEHYQQPENITTVLETLNIVFTAIFGVEAVIKIIGFRHYYFTFPWNVFDLCVLITSVAGIIFEEALQKLVISPTLLRVIRLVRIGRVMRLIKAAKGIRKLLFALVISLPALFNIGALLFLIMFVYAIIGMSLFGHVKCTGGITEWVNFQTFANSILLLFRLTSSAGWNDILEPLMIQPPNCDPFHKNLPNGNCGHRTAAVIYLVSYIIINYMVVINMYIAVILENLSQANKEGSGITEEDIEMFYICWAQYDPNATQFINYGQLSDFVSSLDPPLGIEKPNNPALVAMDLPISSGERLHCLDVLHGLVNRVLGDVEETEEFRYVQHKIDQRFRKTFPTRSQVEVISTTLKRKQQDWAAKIIQRAFKRHQSLKKKTFTSGT